MQALTVQSNNALVQFVTFTLGEETYGVRVGVVGEVIHIKFVAEVPGVPDFIEGITNLRGTVVPVVNLRRRLGLPPPARESAISMMMVVEHQGERVGLMLDSVREVKQVRADDIEAPSAIVSSADSDLIEGIAKTDTGFIIVLDLDRALSRDISPGSRAALPAPSGSGRKALPQGSA